MYGSEKPELRFQRDCEIVMKRAVVISGMLSHDGVRYMPGDELELNDERVEKLSALGVVSLIEEVIEEVESAVVPVEVFAPVAMTEIVEPKPVAEVQQTNRKKRK